jgi:hypothetical protein
MNSIIKPLFLLLLLFTSTLTAQNFKALDFSKLDTQGTVTDLLIKNKSPLSSIGVKHKHYNAYSFLQQYKEFSFSDTKNRFHQLDYLKRLVQPVSYAPTIKIGIMHLEFDEIKSNALKDNLITVDNNVVKRLSSESLFNKNQTTLIAPFAVHKKGLNCKFQIDNTFIINNTDNEIVKIEIDFNNNEGFKTVDIDDYVDINYLSEGDKTLTFKITFSNEETIVRTSPLKISLSNNDSSSTSNLAPTEHTSTLIADLSHPNYNGAASHSGLVEYEIFLGTDNELDKPIFIVDGFDPSDTRTISGTSSIYNLLNFENNGVTENLGDKVRFEDDFDVVIINFPSYFVLANGNLQSMTMSTDVNNDAVIDVLDYPGSTLVDGGADFIERNALSVVEIISIINGIKVGTEENVVIGPSMGGLITRYALNYMEANNLSHETRLWMSFDSPHLGANVPIGFQHLFNYLAYGLDTWVGNFSLESLRPIVDGMLKSPAARQMLTDHYEPHLANGEIAEFDTSLTLPIKHPFSATFFNTINNLTTSGFPETTRNVSLINGSGQGNPYQHQNGNDVLPGDKVLDAFIPGVATFTDAYFDVWFTGYQNQTVKVDDIWIDAPWICFCDINAEANSRAEAFSDGIDAASGGLFDLGALAAGFGTADPTINAFFNSLTTDYFNFIPTVSAMALNTSANIDWYQNISLGAGDIPWDGVTTTNPQTPFVNWYMPEFNEAHVTLTNNNVEFALDEIIKKADVSLKVVLQGAALNPNVGEESLMRDDLRALNLIPTTSPYPDGITCNANVFTAIGNDAIVDWVWVELRDQANNTSIIGSKSALLQRDGDVVDIDGINSLPFEVPGRPYFVVVNHRNHLGAMTLNPVSLSRTTTSIDLTTNTIAMYGSNSLTSTSLTGTLLGLWAGDLNTDGRVRYAGSSNDINDLQSTVNNYPTNTSGSNFFPFNGYHNLDLDMNGQIRYAGSGNDTNKLQAIILSFPGNTFGSNFYPISQQVPN